MISSAADLAKITQYGMGEAGKDKCFELIADFALTAPWAGIGTYNSATDCFSGILDGGGHRIRCVVMAYIDRLAHREGWLVVFDPKLGDWDAKLRHEDVELEGKTIHVFFC